MSIIKDISVSIVYYKSEVKEVLKAIDSVVKNPRVRKVYLIDNSPTDHVKHHINNDSIEYIFTGKNLGFGSAHNLVIDRIKNFSTYHLVLNPDVYFEPEILDSLVSELEKDSQLSLIAPKVLFPDNRIQYTTRKYPSLYEMFLRTMNVYTPKVKSKEYRDQDLEVPFYPEFIYGSFMLFKTKDFIEIGGFDERYFLYMEDVDICKKIDAVGKRKMYYPKVFIYHVLKKESSKSFKLFIRHTISMIKYFNKWGF